MWYLKLERKRKIKSLFQLLNYVDDYLLLSIIYERRETLAIQLSTYEINVRSRPNGIAICFVQEIMPILNVCYFPNDDVE